MTQDPARAEHIRRIWRENESWLLPLVLRDGSARAWDDCLGDTNPIPLAPAAAPTEFALPATLTFVAESRCLALIREITAEGVVVKVIAR